MSGFVAGRPFAAKTFRTAVSSSAFAPRPYTVSVGNATKSPARSRSAARRIVAGSGFAGSTRQTAVGIVILGRGFARLPFLVQQYTASRARPGVPARPKDHAMSDRSTQTLPTLTPEQR